MLLGVNSAASRTHSRQQDPLAPPSDRHRAPPGPRPQAWPSRQAEAGRLSYLTFGSGNCGWMVVVVGCTPRAEREDLDTPRLRPAFQVNPGRPGPAIDAANSRSGLQSAVRLTM